MGRKPDPERKEEILGSVVDYLLERGLHELSLRPLGAAVGVSPRVLIYHFGSKEGLISVALAEAGRRQRAMFERWADEGAGASSSESMLRFWRWLSSEGTAPYVRLFFGVYALGLHGREGFTAYPEGAVTEWIAFAEEALSRAGVPPEQARSEATLLVATVRGLLLDLLATGERGRVDAAIEEFVRQAEWRMSVTVDAGCVAEGGQR